jgi:hypothetical protein
VCDALAHQCYPRNGRCQSEKDCPVFSRTNVNVVCDEAGYCRWPAAAAPPTIPGLAAAGTIVIDAPAIGAMVDSEANLDIVWSAPPDLTIVALILLRIPAALDEVLDAAVWGAEVGQQAPPHLGWTDGVAIRSGMWTSSTASARETSRST